ncbi:hypothetical protein ILUMI_13472 [Ignelater luminosus]|uniref:UDP-glucuronosyltransferase n=1 Tax=Ignelater luminosus TaxID=2038154 RepID=A0A8K0CSB9_IGNLU|nr:hypothetical protein ILUMI_13472 [Ignelater luminosus]
MILRLVTLLDFVCLLLHTVYGAKILGVFAAPSISHQVVFQPIWKELSLRGHEVTVITPNPLNDKSLVNLTEIDVSFSYRIVTEANLQRSIEEARLYSDVVVAIYNIFINTAQEQLNHPKVQDLIKDKTKHFDLVIAEHFTPAMFAFSALYNCPLIGIISLGATLNGHDVMGNPSHPILNPDFSLPFQGQLGFFDRIYSVLYSIWYRYYYHYNFLPQQDKIAKKYFGENLPYIGDIEKNISILLTNENVLIHPVRPNVPAVVQMGNMHIQKAKPLPKDLQKELDGATHGVVYFSLGSNIKSVNLSEETREKIIGALSEIPYKVLWKWEDQSLPGQPKNVIIRRWFPQQDILGHPNTKVFVTQGGLQSIEESIFKGVPIVGIPFFADQPLNVKKMLDLGIAQAVDINTLTKENLKAAILEVAQNPKYRNKVRELAQLVTDVPMTGLEKAVWWSEYVIRHKGARHLRSPAIDLPIYQYFLLDVIGFLLAVVIVSIIIVYKIVKLSIRFVKSFFKITKQKIS